MVEATAANVHDIAVASKLLREDDAVVYGGPGYLDIEKRPEIAEVGYLYEIDCYINRCPRKQHRMKDYGADGGPIIERRQPSIAAR